MRFIPLLIVVALLAPFAPAETFRTERGNSFEAQITGVYGDIVFLKNKQGSASIDLGSLDDASLAHVADFLAKPRPAVPWSASESRMAKALAKRLEILRDDKLVAFDRGTRPEPEFYLVYFGAHWCGPCRRFSPGLLRAYQQMKALAPDRFEVIFVSDDRDRREQLTYIRELPMPWPVASFGANITALDRWRGNGIPCLVVLTRDGEMLLHSYSGTEYLGATDPLEKFRVLLQHVLQNTPSPARHRLAIATHVRAARGGDRAPERYIVTIDPNRNRTLPQTPIDARVSIDARGHVVAAEFAPALELVAETQLQREAENWLFLPAVKQGRPVATDITFTIQGER